MDVAACEICGQEKADVAPRTVNIAVEGQMKTITLWLCDLDNGIAVTAGKIPDVTALAGNLAPVKLLANEVGVG